MKKFLIVFTCLVVAATVTAFSLKDKPVKEKMDTLYYYYTDGATVGSYINSYSTHEAAVTGSGCVEETEDLCARGYKLEQLVDQTPGNPPVDVDDFEDEIFKEDNDPLH